MEGSDPRVPPNETLVSLKDMSKDQALPDSTTTSTAAAATFLLGGSMKSSVPHPLQVSVDTAMDSFPDLFLGPGEQTILSEEVNTILSEERLGGGGEKKDLLASAILTTVGEEVMKDEGALYPSDSEIVSSTISGFPDDEKKLLTTPLPFATPPSVQISESQQQQQSNNVIVVSNPGAVNNPSDVYTLTLTDGSVVQLRVQSEQQAQQQAYGNNNSSIELKKDESCWAQRNDVSPPSVAAEITLPFSNPSTPSTLSHPSSPLPILSPVGSVDQHPLLPSASSAALAHRSESFSSEDAGGSLLEDESSSSASFDDDTLLSMFSCMDQVTIESLKAQLTTLPEGQTDLGALLVAAKIDLTVDDIVGPPLTQVKRIMEAKGLADWQVQLCIKIRRRKKNTVRKNFFFVNCFIQRLVRLLEFSFARLVVALLVTGRGF